MQTGRRDNHKELGVGGIIILKQILTQDGRARTGCELRIGISGRLLQTW